MQMICKYLQDHTLCDCPVHCKECTDRVRTLSLGRSLKASNYIKNTELAFSMNDSCLQFNQFSGAFLRLIKAMHGI